MTPQLHITQHKRFVPYGVHSNFAFGGTSFMLGTLFEIPNLVFIRGKYLKLNPIQNIGANEKMAKILKIDRALYEVDDKTKTYKYYGRNLDWKNLNPSENEKNKKSIDGYTRIFPDGRQKVFRYLGTKKVVAAK